MRGNVISYFEMCQREGSSLQRGMNFRLHGRHSVILMSIHPIISRFCALGTTLKRVQKFSESSKQTHYLAIRPGRRSYRRPHMFGVMHKEIEGAIVTQ
jgi:hypothetical protein